MWPGKEHVHYGPDLHANPAVHAKMLQVQLAPDLL